MEKTDFLEYIGRKSGRLAVIDVVTVQTKKVKQQKMLKCSCSCGRETNVLPYQFRNGSVRSCGCLRSVFHAVRDGRSYHPLYAIWYQMMRRCYYEKTDAYYRYGGRGIYVCDEWHDFLNFAKWSDSVGGRPNGYTLDRINNDGPYSPENCRWATMHDQCRNKSDNVIIEYNGKSQALVDWADEIGINKPALQHRYNRGWSIERMMTEPLHEKPNHKAGA